MTAKQMGALVAAFALAALAGFRASSQGGIQPGYFEKQEAPAYGVSKDKPMGSELGKDYEEHFKKLYDEP
jgi:hypothetical protein